MGSFFFLVGPNAGFVQFVGEGTHATVNCPETGYQTRMFVPPYRVRLIDPTARDIRDVSRLQKGLQLGDVIFWGSSMITTAKARSRLDELGLELRYDPVDVVIPARGKTLRPPRT